MQPWKTKVVCAGRYRPRQFEYHPKFEDVVVFGTLRGESHNVGLGLVYSMERERARDYLLCAKQWSASALLCICTV